MTNKKKVFKTPKMKWLSIVIVLAFAMVGCKQSYEEQMADYQKQADEFKASLSNDNKIFGECIDSIAQKIYYFDSMNYELKEYNLATKKESILSEFSSLYPEKRDDAPLMDLKITKSKVYGHRLFLLVYSYYEDFSEGHQASNKLYYIDILDNSFHYISGGDEFDGGLVSADFLEEGVLMTEEYKWYFEGMNYGEATRQFLLPANLSESEMMAELEKQRKAGDDAAQSDAWKKSRQMELEEKIETYERERKSQNTITTSSYQSTSNSVRQRLEQANQEYFQYINEYNSTSDYMWKMQRLQAAYNANERCIGLARELGNQSVLNGFLQRKAALESMGVR